MTMPRRRASGDRLRRRAGRRRRRASRSARRGVLDHRTERRRQDHAVQPDVRPLPARRRAACGLTARTSPASRRTSWRAAALSRTFQNLQIFFRMTRARERHGRPPPARERPASRRSPASARRSGGRTRRRATPRRAALLARVGLGGSGRAAGRRAVLRRASSGSRSPARSRPSPRCCCSTSPPPAAMRSRPPRSTAIIRGVAARRRHGRAGRARHEAW